MASKKDFLSPAVGALPVCAAVRGLETGLWFRVLVGAQCQVWRNVVYNCVIYMIDMTDMTDMQVLFLPKNKQKKKKIQIQDAGSLYDSHIQL